MSLEGDRNSFRAEEEASDEIGSTYSPDDSKMPPSEVSWSRDAHRDQSTTRRRYPAPAPETQARDERTTTTLHSDQDGNCKISDEQSAGADYEGRWWDLFTTFITDATAGSVTVQEPTPGAVNVQGGFNRDNQASAGAGSIASWSTPRLAAWLVREPLAAAIPVSVSTSFDDVFSQLECGNLCDVRRLRANSGRRNRRGYPCWAGMALIFVATGLFLVLGRWVPADVREEPFCLESSLIDLVQSKIQSISFEDPSSSQRLALDWMVSDCESTEETISDYKDANKVLERFALATFWFATEGYSSAWKHKHRWMTSVPVCEWGGEVFCGGGPHNLVDEFLFGGLKTGYIPEEIGLLTGLTHLELIDNNFHHTTIPSEIGLLTDLEKLAFARSKLSGTLPTELGLLTSLKRVDMAYNYFSGPVPSQMSNLVELKYLRVFNNTQLTGSIPSSLCQGLANAFVDCDKIACECCKTPIATPCAPSEDNDVVGI